jgi:hypothetical protein
MRIFRINKYDQEQFAELPEVAMDMNFGQAGGAFYLVLTCAIATLLDERTVAEPEDNIFRRTRLMQGISAEERTAALLSWVNELPPLQGATTATPAQAWSSFWGAVNPSLPSAGSRQVRPLSMAISPLRRRRYARQGVWER